MSHTGFGILSCDKPDSRSIHKVFFPGGPRFLSGCALGICEGYEVASPAIYGEQIRHHFPSYG